MMAHTATTPGAVMINVKAALQAAEGSNPEIRRFRLSVGESADVYDRVLSTVCTVFSVEANSKCTLFWKDEDDDLVQFSTNEEFRHAVDNMRDDTLRLYVTVTPGESAEGEDRHVTFDTPQMTSHGFHPPPPPQHPNPHHPLHPHHHHMHPHWMGMGHGGAGFACGKKGKKMAKKMWKMHKKANKASHKEFMTVRLQVPEEFRRWVREYLRAWFKEGGHDAVQVQAKLPRSLNLDPEVFSQWMHAFLTKGKETQARAAEAESMETADGPAAPSGDEGFLPAPLGLPDAYYRWLCFIAKRFAFHHSHGATTAEAAAAEDAAADCFMGWQGLGHRGWKGKKGKCKKWCKKWGQGEGCKSSSGSSSSSSSSSSSESESNMEGDQKGKNRQVPKEFRKYVRTAMKHLHKNKGGKAAKAQEKATLAGVSPEVTDFIAQLLLEWHAKLSQKRPRAVAMEMMSGERTLPEGMQREDFLWLCRFVGRWHRMHAGKCDLMANWSSGSSSDDPGEDTCTFKGFGPWSRGHRLHFRAAKKAMRCGPYGGHPCARVGLSFGGMGPCGRMGPHHFGGMDHPFGGMGPHHFGGMDHPFGGMGPHHFGGMDHPFGGMGPHDFGGMDHPFGGMGLPAFGGMGPHHGFMGRFPPSSFHPTCPAFSRTGVMTPSCPVTEVPIQGHQNQAAARHTGSTDDVVEHVTQGVKKM